MRRRTICRANYSGVNNRVRFSGISLPGLLDDCQLQCERALRQSRVGSSYRSMIMKKTLETQIAALLAEPPSFPLDTFNARKPIYYVGIDDASKSHLI